MKTICIISGLCVAIGVLFAADSFLVEKLDPAAAGMSPERLARIAPRMKEFVVAGKAAGIVTLVARHGHIASLNAVGYQDPSYAIRLHRVRRLSRSPQPRSNRPMPFPTLRIRRRAIPIDVTVWFVQPFGFPPRVLK